MTKRQPNKLDQFTNFLKRGMPPRAVREKMLKARIPLKEIDLFFRRHAASKMKEQRANVQEIGSNSINPRLKPFLKMIQAGVPAPGVRQKMIMGRVPPQEIEKFFQTIKFTAARF